MRVERNRRVPVALTLVASVVFAACVAAPAAPPEPLVPRYPSDPAPVQPPTTTTAPAPPPERTCDLPASGQPFTEAHPSEVGIDPAAARQATDDVAARLTSSFRIYRHGCLVAKNLLDEPVKDTPLPYFSMTKSVVSLAVGRAIELGHLGLHDPIGPYVPAADERHGAITVYQLLTQTSGLRFSWANDLFGSIDDGVGTALWMPFAYEPGTTFQYAQTTVSLLAYVVQQAVGQDFQAFVDAELFQPIGIRRNEWVWERDGAGNTHGYAWLSMTPAATARLGFLVLHEGSWEGRRLVSPGYIHDMGEGTAANDAYGYLTPTNSGEWGYTSFGRNFFEGPRTPAAPSDLVVFSGFLDQVVAVIPSLDLVIVRLGFPAGDGWDHEMYRTLLPGIAGFEYEDPGPFVPGKTDVPIEQLIDLPLLIRQIVDANPND